MIEIDMIKKKLQKIRDKAYKTKGYEESYNTAMNGIDEVISDIKDGVYN